MLKEGAGFFIKTHKRKRRVGSKQIPNENEKQPVSKVVEGSSKRFPLKSIGNNSQAGSSHANQEIRGKSIRPTTSQPGTSKANGGFFEHQALLKLKPRLPQVSLPFYVSIVPDM